MFVLGLGVPGLLEDGMMDRWLDYREYNLNANAISTTIFLIIFWSIQNGIMVGLTPVRSRPN